MKEVINYSVIVIIVLVLAYFFKGPFYKIMGSIKNIFTSAMPQFNLIYI